MHVYRRAVRPTRANWASQVPGGREKDEHRGRMEEGTSNRDTHAVRQTPENRAADEDSLRPQS